jgi:cobaltochelatase CobN
MKYWLKYWLTFLLLAVVASASGDVPRVPRIAVVSIELAQFPNLARAAAARLRGRMSIDVFGLGGGLLPSVEQADLAAYDLVVIEGVGPQLLAYSGQIDAAKTRTRVLVVNGERWIKGNVDPISLPDLQAYWNNATEENYTRLFEYLAARVLNVPASVQPPVVYPELAFYHPAAPRVFADLDAYEAWESGRLSNASARPRVAILFYRSSALAKNATVIDALIREVERQGGMPFPLWRKDSAQSFEALMAEGRSRVDVVILCGNWIDYVHHDGGVGMAKRLNVPVLSCATDYAHTPAEWEQERGGFAPGQSGQLALGETEGIVEPMIVGARTLGAGGTASYTPVGHQVEWRVARALRWARLRHLPNAEKRIVIAYYSEGQNKADIGSDPDAYLDAQGSLVALLNRLKSEGYDVGAAPLPDKATLSRMMSERGANPRTAAELDSLVRNGDVALLPEAQYRQWWSKLPDSARLATEKVWGPPPGKLMVHVDRMTGARSLVVPLLKFGKVALVPHPVWGMQDERALGQTGALPPHHQYAAFYLWMRDVWRADAFLPMFTQLSLMPGKQEGPSSTDWVGLLIGNLPHVQPAPLQANGGIGNKRRTNAVLVGFMPELVRAGLAPELAALSSKLRDADRDPALQPTVRKETARLNLATALGMDPASAEWSALSAALTRYLDEIARAPIPNGGHVLGRVPSASVAERMIRAMVASVRSGAPSIQQIRAVMRGEPTTLPVEMASRIREYSRRIDAAPRELDGIVAALAGRYVEPGPNQDAIRNPDALPGGRNPYTLDTRALPTPQAWAIGARLAEETIASFRRKHGEMPRKLAFVLWSVETIQNGGVLEAQILRLLGARPVWNAKGQVVDVALDDREALGRARVDVLVTTSGTYRDHFGDKIELLAKAARLASEKDEPDNPVRRETLAREARALAGGLTARQAQLRALRRIFSTAPGAYSPATEFALHAQTRWSDERMAKLYSDRLSHAYGESDSGVADGESFSENLKTVDGAVFGRSSNVYGLLDTPMPAAYLGGLSMAVRTSGGREIETYIAQVQSPDSARVEDIARTYGRELRSRYFNPAWIEAMKASGYDGARHMADFADNLLLWDVTSPQLVSDADWNELHDVYVRDRYHLGLERYFARENPQARVNLMNSMLEAAARGRWHADAKVLSELRAEVARAKVPHAPASAPNAQADSAQLNARRNAVVRGLEMVTSTPGNPKRLVVPQWIWMLWAACAIALVVVGAIRRPAW